MSRPRVAVSACLLGEAVRWDGAHKRDAYVTDELARLVELVPVCPEVEIGLGVPREPVRIDLVDGERRLVAPGIGSDHTAAMRAYAEREVTELRRLGIAGCVLKSRSPSCGVRDTPVHPDGGEPTDPGPGSFTEVLQARLPGLPIEDERALQEPSARASFLECVFDYARTHR